MPNYRFSPEALAQFEEDIQRETLVEMDACGYLCPRCRSKIHYNRAKKLYYCVPCEFVETKAQYRETLNDIRRTLSLSGEPIRIPDQERELARLRSRRIERQELLDVVYYIRFRDVVKIGTTHTLKGRLSSLPWEEVLAIEPGDMQVERHRHKQFAKIRFMDEWFRDSRELADHIRRINFDNNEWRQCRFPDLPSFPWSYKTVVIPADPERITVERAARLGRFNLATRGGL